MKMRRMSIPQLAQAALDRAKPGFFGRLGGAIQNAEESMTTLRDEATLSGDQGAAWVAEIALAASRAAEPHAKSRLELLRHTFRALEDATAGSAGYLAGIASSMRDPLDAMKCPKPVRDEVVRAVLHEAARVTARDGAPEASYLDMLADLSDLIQEPGYALNMATRIGMDSVGDVTRPAWLASVGGNFSEAEIHGPTPLARSILDYTSERVRAVAEERQDASVPAWFARVEEWKALPLDDRTKFFLDRVLLGVLGDEIPSAPESGLVLVYRMRREIQDPRQRDVLLDRALQEARQATYPPGDRAGRWLDFLERSQGRLRQGALQALAEGKPARAESVSFDVRWHLKEQPATAGEVLEALFVLQPPSNAAEAATLGLGVAELTEDPMVQEVLLGRTLARAEALEPDRAETKVGRIPGANRLDLLKFALRSLAGQGDGTDRALVRAAAPPPPEAAPPIAEEPDWVQIGSIRVPRRSSSPG